MVEQDKVYKLEVIGNIKQIRERVQSLGISITFTERKITEDWVGNPKGLKQIFFERGLLDINNLKLYLKSGPKDENGRLYSENFALNPLISVCTDFVEEAILLQPRGKEIGKSLGISIIMD